MRKEKYDAFHSGEMGTCSNFSLLLDCNPLIMMLHDIHTVVPVVGRTASGAKRFTS